MASTGEAFGLFWDSENGDRTYSASSFEYWLKKFFTSGVFNGDLQVKATSGMTLEVGAGYTNVDGKVKFWNAPFNVTLDAANSTYPRVDTIVIRRDNVNRQITCEKVTGAYSGDTPQPTAPTRNSEIFELVIAQIDVGAGVTGIVQSNITDTRPNNELCGYITGTVEELDFSAFTTQFEAYFAEFKRNQMADFQAWEVAQQAAYAAWFNLVKQQQIQDKADWDAWYAALQEELHELPEDTAEYLQIEIDEIRTSGTTGSILKISTTETSLEGKTVTVTNGTETRTATFDENLECLIAGYKGTGEVTISSSDGIQTASTTVTIPYFGNYTYNIAFWAATVNIQGDDNLKGATITVKDSDNQTVDTVVLNVITGRGVFTAQKADTYTFNYTYQGTDYSESLVVDEETTYSLELNAGFSWQTWVTEGGLDPTDYEDLDELLEDEAALRRLFTVHASTDYMCSLADVNADLEKIIYNDLCAKWINLRDYALDNMAANSAIKAVMDEADKYGYGEWALVGQVPTMTSATAPYGTVIESGEHATNYAGWKAFDGDDSSNWIAPSANTNNYIGYTFINPIKISRVKVAIVFSGSSNTPSRTFKIQGSNDGFSSDVNDLGTLTVDAHSPSSKETYYVDLTNTSSYNALRLFCADTLHVAGSWAFNVITLQFYAWAPKGNVPVMTANNAPYGEASASSEYSSYPAFMAFDKTDSTWVTNNSASSFSNIWIGYKFTNPTCVKRFKIVIGTKTTAMSVKLQASNDGFVSDINDLTDVINGSSSSWATPTTYDVNNDDYYMSYRLFIVSQTLDSSAYGGRIMLLQFYGRELKVSVPKMTSNTAPYGTVSVSASFNSSWGDGYKVFTDDANGWLPSVAVDNYLSYHFTNITAIKKVVARFGRNGTSPSNPSFVIEGSNDGLNWSSILSEQTISDAVRHEYESNNDNAYEYVRIRNTNIWSSSNASWYTPLLYLQFYGLDYSEREFEEGVTKKWLYDHGLLLDGQAFNMTDGKMNGPGYTRRGTITEIGNVGYRLQSAIQTYSFVEMFFTNPIDFTNYSLLRANDSFGNISFSSVAIDVSSITTSNYIGVISCCTTSTSNVSGRLQVRPDCTVESNTVVAYLQGGDHNIVDFTELWLE